MITVKVLIDSVEKVKKFSSIISQQGADCELIEGVHIMDAKSIMGIFSLDLSKPIDLNIHAEDNLDEILATLKPYIIE